MFQTGLFCEFWYGNFNGIRIPKVSYEYHIEIWITK